ncbi:hypothetical protein [uncultured Ruegeria sp.]|uniref:hypothetical protein n=1 Tax=uncultured Ruegeria sp. TaxID=259304 RepID=UPI00261739EB|nr:hypothetical protein [uncultured Ruegeria sp.]
MHRALSFALLLATAVPALAELPQPQGHVLLTLGGDVSETNLPTRDENDGGLLGYLEVTHDGAAGFDAAMLDALEQFEIKIPYGLPDNQRDYAFSGPLLSEVMIMAGAEGKKALPMALDGYQAEIEWDSIATNKPIVATHADGAPLGIGGYGPTMIVFPPTDDADQSAKQAGQQVWAIAYIAVE